MENKGTVPFRDQGRIARGEGRARTQAGEDERGSVLKANSIHSWVFNGRLTGFSTVCVVQSRSQRTWLTGRARRTAVKWHCYFGQLSRGRRLDTASHVSPEDSYNQTGLPVYIFSPSQRTHWQPGSPLPKDTHLSQLPQLGVVM